MIIHIEDLVEFAPNYGVSVNPAILEQPPEKIIELLTLAFEHMNNEHLRDACCGGRGPLAPYLYRGLDFDVYLALLEQIRIAEETKHAKRRITKTRRSEFQRERAVLALKMIDAGIPFVCAKADCGFVVDLTIDHKIPLSRGGTDDLENLQFMCRWHNSEKGDRAEVAA
jgi:hypothetical protein